MKTISLQLKEEEKSLLSFFNEETEHILKEYLHSRTDKDPRLFTISDSCFQEVMTETSKKLGIHITAKSLRDFFASELGELSVPDRYVDAFQGRTPKKILARHYTDYKPERLKVIYDKAALTVLG